MNTEFLLAFSVYGLILAIISYSFYKKSKNAQDFMLGNRSLNYVATAIATHSSDMSIWLFMGLPGSVYLFGMKQAWIPVGLVCGMFLTWHYVAQQLRTATEKYNSYTLSSYFEKRFNDTSGSLRLISAFLALLFFVFYISSGLVAMGNMFESVFHIDYYCGTFIGLLITLIYTLAGGFIGVAWCDLFQGLFLLIMIMLVPFFGYQLLPNGWTTITDVAHLKSISLSMIPHSFKEIISCVLLATSWGLGYFGQPHILVNFMGSKSGSSIKKAKYIGMTWQCITLSAAVLVGLIGIGLFTNTLTNNELIFVEMVQLLFSPFIAGFVLCAIIAAGLTTIDTQILVSGSIFAEDIYKQFFNKKATDKKMLFISRAGVIIISLISFVIACTRISSVYGLVDYAWTGLGSSFGPVILTSLYCKKITKHGTIVGMIVGGLIAALWPWAGSTIPAMIPGFFSNLTIILLLSKKK
ncbi:sodium/proline symporter [Candidatus Babeliales bacterium]|nr:sodium/proline symporter [Candidatus Babeliales bacterium]